MVRREMADRLFSARPRPTRAQRTMLAGLVSIALGCQPEIGDTCVTSSDCSAAGDRLCDTTQPDGYCTVFNCEPGTCPEDEAICVAFGAERSTLPECASGDDSRLLRTFCMKTCEADSNCRPDFICADVGRENAWGAEVIESSLERTRACLLPRSGGPIDQNETGVCAGSDAGLPEPPSGAGGASAGGSGSEQGGAGEAGAASGGAAGAG
jgi:hypothetical protein